MKLGRPEIGFSLGNPRNGKAGIGVRKFYEIRNGVIWLLVAAGHTQRAVASMLGLSDNSIHRIIRQLKGKMRYRPWRLTAVQSLVWARIWIEANPTAIESLGPPTRDPHLMEVDDNG